jgi:hypothetical protein
MTVFLKMKYNKNNDMPGSTEDKQTDSSVVSPPIKSLSDDGHMWPKHVAN